MRTTKIADIYKSFNEV